MPRSSVALAGDIERLEILDASGEVDPELEPSLAPDRLLEMHRSMLLARRFDEQRLSLQRRGDIGTFAPVNGQEAAQVGPMENIGPDDWFVPAFRETAAALHRGADPAALLIYDAGFNEGAAQQRDQRDLPIAVPVASQLPHAAGIAFALQQWARGSGRPPSSGRPLPCVITFFGDGATSEGDFHEALNFAGVFDLPVVFVCQNNQWAISTPREQQSASVTLAQKALAYGIPGVQVDGNDVLATYVAARGAVERARQDGGATLIEALTYRMSVHTTADDPDKYRDPDDVERWRERDPIERLQRYLRRRELLDDGELEAQESDVKQRIDDAWERARERIAALSHEPAAMFDHLTAERWPAVEAQRRAFLAGRPGGDSA